MSVPEYEDRGPIAATSQLDLQNLEGKSVIVTGGGSGLGKAYAQGFAGAGAYVTIADFNETAGNEVAAALGASKAQFVRCDVRNWDDQVKVFESAIKSSPHKSCDIVIANAGIIKPDDVFLLQDPSLPPEKPNLDILDVNLIGMAYTVKLAMHYFRRQPLEPSRDRCLIIKASLAGYVDQPAAPQYNASKWAARGMMRSLRRTAWKENIRVNLVAPWYADTAILPQPIKDYLTEKWTGVASVEDCSRAMLKIASDRSINGRGLGVVPRKMSPEGYMDLDHDDYRDPDPLKEWQRIVLDTADKIFG